MCVFCRIINGEIPSYKVYEDEKFLAILDISQATRGHVLLIPKKHVENIYGLQPEEQALIGTMMVKLAKAIKKATGTDSLNIVNNNGMLAGQTVNHFHMHFIPRYENDTVAMHFENHMENLKKEDYEKIQNEIRSEL